MHTSDEQTIKHTQQTPLAHTHIHHLPLRPPASSAVPRTLRICTTAGACCSCPAAARRPRPQGPAAPAACAWTLWQEKSTEHARLHQDSVAGGSVECACAWFACTWIGKRKKRRSKVSDKKRECARGCAENVWQETNAFSWLKHTTGPCRRHGREESMHDKNLVASMCVYVCASLYICNKTGSVCAHRRAEG